nr:hypothetical protein [Tanacetum cinerariifolium]
MPPKPDLVFHTAPIAVETTHLAFTVQLSLAKLAQDISHTTRTMAPIIEDWVSDSEDESKPNDPQIPATVLTKSKPVSVIVARPVSADVPKIMATKPRHARSLYTKTNSLIRRHETRSNFSKTSNLSPKVSAAHAKAVSAAKGNKGKWVWRPKHNILDHDSSASKFLKRLDHVDALGRSKFTWVFFLATKDETSSILKTFITGLENKLSLKVKVIKRDNGTEFKNSDLNQLCDLKGIKREFSVPRTPQQNGIAKRKNMTPIEAARTMLNRVLVTKPQNKTPYELVHGRTPSIGFMKPFGCPVTILNTLDSLGKFEGKVNERFLVGYSVNSKALRVFNSTGPTWLFDIDSLTRITNYQPVTTGNQSNPSAGKTGEEANQQYMLFPVWSTSLTNPQNKEGAATFDGKEHDAEKPESTINLSPSSSALSGEQDNITRKKNKGKSHVDYFTGNKDFNEDFEDYSEDSSNDVSAAGPIVCTAVQNYSNSTNPISAAGPSNSNTSPIHGNSLFQIAAQSPDMLESEDIVYSNHENVGAEADFNNLETSITISLIPTTRIYNAHPISQIIGTQKGTSSSQRSKLDEAMQEELLQFKMQKVWILVDLPHGKGQLVPNGFTEIKRMKEA